MAEAHARLLTLVRERMAAPSVASPTRHRGAIERVGRAAVLVGRILRAQVAFLGRVGLELAALLRRPGLFASRKPCRSSRP
jgi:hypothetical protein